MPGEMPPKNERGKNPEELTEEELAGVGKKTKEVAEEWGKGWRVKEAEKRAEKWIEAHEEELFRVEGPDAEFLNVEKPEKTMDEVRDELFDYKIDSERDRRTKTNWEKIKEDATKEIGDLEAKIKWLEDGVQISSGEDAKKLEAELIKRKDRMAELEKRRKVAETAGRNAEMRLAQTAENIEQLEADDLAYKKRKAVALMKSGGWATLEEARKSLKTILNDMDTEMLGEKGDDGKRSDDGYIKNKIKGLSDEERREVIAEIRGDRASTRLKYELFDDLIKIREVERLSAEEGAGEDEPVVEVEPEIEETEPEAESESIDGGTEPEAEPESIDGSEKAPEAFGEDGGSAEDGGLHGKYKKIELDDELYEKYFTKYGEVLSEDSGNPEIDEPLVAEEMTEDDRAEMVARTVEGLSGQKPSVWKKIKTGFVKKAMPVLLAAGILVGMPSVAAFAQESHDAQYSGAKTEQVVNVDDMAEFQAVDNRETAQNGVKYNYTDYLSRADKADYDNGVYTKDQLIEKGWKTSYNAYGTSVEDLFENKDGSIESILEACKNSPEVLASHVSYFPSVLEKCGLAGKSAGEIDDILSNGENGGELQERLLAAYEEVLKAEGTTYTFYYENGTEQSRYIYWMDDNGDGEYTPNEMHLAFSEEERGQDTEQLRVVTVSGESADFNMSCGWQPNQDEEIQGVPQIVVKVATNETTPETPTTPETQIAPKNEQAEIDNANRAKEAGATDADLTQTPSEDLENGKQPRTEESGIPEWERQQAQGQQPQQQEINQAVGDQTGVSMSEGDYTSEQATQAREAQKQANQNEDTTPMTDEEFASEIERILNGGRS